MEIVVSLFAVLVAFSCLYVLVRSDIRDKRKLQMVSKKKKKSLQ